MPSKPLKPPKQRSVSLPQPAAVLWPVAVSAIPNAVLRGALFTVSQRRAWSNREMIASTTGIDIRFKGQRFNQTDLDTWEMVLHLVKHQANGNRVDFSAHAMLRMLGRDTGLSQHKQLHEELVRLRSGTTEITWTEDRKTFGGGLIVNFFRDEDTGRYVVLLDPRMRQLYEVGFVQVDWGQRQALGTNNLAKWLHVFYASHAAPHDYKVAAIRDLCGSTTKELREFRRSLKKALAELVDTKAIMSWSINDQDLVSVVKVPSPPS